MCNEVFTLLPGSCGCWFWVLTSGQCVRIGTPWRKDAGPSWRSSPPPLSYRKMEAITTSIICCVVCLGQRNVSSQEEKGEGGGRDAEQWISVSARLMTEVRVENYLHSQQLNFVKHLVEIVDWHVSNVKCSLLSASFWLTVFLKQPFK